MKRFTRRDFLRASAASLGTLAISTGLSGCFLNDDDDGGNTTPVINATFTHGVASGDPLTDRVIIWTRAVPVDSSTTSVPVIWEVASDSTFGTLLHNGQTQTTADQDFTVKVDIQNLSAGQTLYYRFRAGSATSMTGMTRTLPEGSVDKVVLAVFSCSNYPAGYFHAFREAALRDDLDAVVHLGDYIYEYGNGEYATEDAEALGRTFAAGNEGELFTLVDYRARYALYRSDEDMQALHSRVPFITVWDDHEIANDAFKNGAENHNADEGDFTARKLVALQAYFEWLPIRPVAEDNQEEIYRRFQFGDLLTLHMLDTRLIGREEQLNYLDYLDPLSGAFNTSAFVAAAGDPNRTLLGAEQLAWLQAGLAASTTTWDALGQQVLMGRMNLPAEMLGQLLNPTPAALAMFAELATLKARLLAGDPTLTAEERARIETVLPYNLDAWDGYAVERETVLETSAALDRNLVVLAGDTHNSWANDLKTLGGTAVGVEFAGTSVSSPGLEEYLSLPDDEAVIQQTELGLTLLVDNLHYANISQRGYMTVTFTPTEARADWYHVSTVKSRSYTVPENRSRALKVLPGAANRKIVEV
jgi:alkaline phosphatase D